MLRRRVYGHVWSRSGVCVCVCVYTTWEIGYDNQPL
jgi:hypothetical protein